MPANYAHYRFAQQMLPELRGRIGDWTQLYFAGCHGPDPLYYFNPFRDNPVNRMADTLHLTSGRELFQNCCLQLRKEPSPGSRAYLLGLLTHYCLDSDCHPYVNDLVARGVCDHTELETEFDRFLLALDGESAPHTRHLGAHMHLTLPQCREAALLYPPLTGRQFRRSYRNMRAASAIVSGRTLLTRPLLERTLPLFGAKVRYQMMTKGPNPRVMPFIDPLHSLYQRSVERFPGLLRQLEDHLTRELPLGDAFAPDLG